MQFLKYFFVFLLIGIYQQGKAEDDIINQFQKSYKLESDGKYIAAIQELKKIKADSYALNLRLGWLSYLAGRYKDGEMYYAKAILLRPSSIEGRLGFVLPAAKLKEWDKVATQYDAILRTDPNNYKANYYRGLMFYNVGNYKQASQYLNRIVELYPFDYDAVILAGWNEFFMKNKQRAKTLFIQAKLIQPNSASADEGLKKCN